MSDTLRSGNEELDAVLGGGLPANAISLIMGLPGTGKTIVAQQYAFHAGHPDRPTVYFSTLSEPLEKIVRFGQTLDFFETSAIGTSVFYEDLGETVSADGLAGVVEQVTATLKQRRPGLVVIDSFKALRTFARDDAEFRRFLHQLAGLLTAFPAAALWIGEYDAPEIALLPEFAVADAIVDLATVRSGEREMRFLQVRKLRGGGFRSGRHAYRLSREGLHLFPRLADVPAAGEYPLGERADFQRPRRPGHDAGRRLLARRLHARRGPDRIGKDGHGAALHLRGGPPGRAWGDRHPPGEPHPAAADGPRPRLAG